MSARPILAAVVATFIAASAVVVGLSGESPANATAPCVAHTPSGDETTFLGLLQQWRDGNIAGSQQLSQSAPLNAAAMGYAQYLANTPGAQGHGADGAPGYPWATRAVQCGYPANLAAGGEGLAVVESSTVVTVSAQQALNTMTAERGGGVWVPSDVGLPVKCVGVGKATSTSGKKVAWVTLIFAASGSCPQQVSGGGTSPSPSSSATNTATNTATPTATPSPSPTPKPVGATIALYSGWNLVVLPEGKVADVLYRAAGCYRAVYQQQGGHWLRYSPDVPAYANNLQTLNGGTFWIEGTAENCGLIAL
mgnify:CR=1 FL=1